MTAVLYNGLCRYEEALAAAEQADHPQELWSTLVLPELIEAAARSGQAARARKALGRLAETARASGTDWALGIEARSRALLVGDEAAVDLYREAIDRLAALACASSWPALICCTANGCAASTAGVMPVISSARPMRFSWRPAWWLLPNGHGWSCARPVSGLPNGPRRRATC
jgi:hypothetical protein